MKIKNIRTRVFVWKGDVIPPQQNFCTNAMDILSSKGDQMQSFRFYSWLLVEIETDDGYVGLGNAALAPKICKQIIDEYLAPLLFNENPFDVEYLWQKMYRSTHAWGRKGVGMVAISAIDIALWDIMGKACQQPVFRLLGGRTKDKIPIYASKLYSQPLDSLAAEAQSYKDQGYQAMKMRFGWGPKDGAVGMRKNVDLVKTIRDVIGMEIDLMCEVYMGWTLEYARRMVPLLEPFHIRWLEEAVIADDLEGYRELKAMNRFPIAGGEHEYTIYGFKEMLESKALDVIQFDTNRVGGITQAKKIQSMAEAYSVPVIPHAGQMHNFHLVMSSVNSPIAEFFPVHSVEVGNELFWYLFKGEPEPENGFIQLQDEVPGLGLEISTDHFNDFEIIE